MSDYIDGDLPDEQKAVFDAHFKGCEKCRAFFMSFKSSLDLIEYLDDKPCPTEVKSRLEKLIESRLAGSKTGSSAHTKPKEG